MSVAKAGSRAKDAIILVVIVIVAVGGIAGYGFYHDEVSSYVRLQGWNMGPVKGLTQQFVEAMASNEGEKVASMISPQAPDLKPVKEGGKITALTVYRYGSKTPETLVALAPTKTPTLSEPKLQSLQGGAVVVNAGFPDDLSLDISWDKTGEGWKVVGISRIKPGQ